ncbi:MAG: 2-hydroxyacyl-CoA dehydratase subunit D [Candidatus Thorarchaeota archaeon]|nr:MAG: 2-hydroxyglutaryl-CoA dehydratase [Candidatus Thorarchaeota archaeon]RLI59325.1 MAG: 2-hydroxyglutaryl-CoA dehydratase [Candidatus Thorarchaeota archaeon]
MTEGKEKVYRQLESNKLLQQIMFRYMLEGHAASEEHNLAWVTSGFPVEIPVAMGVGVSYPEQYGAVVGSQKVGPTVCGFAEDVGYSRELCSYARASIGAALKPEESPLEGLPRPQALLACNNICGTVLRWYDAISEITGAPVYLLDTPPLGDSQPEHHKEYVKAGVHSLIEFLGSTFNTELEEDKLHQTAGRSSTAIRLWTESLEACKSRPSPLNCADRFLAMAPVVSLRGTDYIIDFYEALLDEVKTRVKDGVGAIREERIRLLWDNIPPWFNIFRFFNGLAKKGVVFPADTYTHAWSGAIEGTDLIDSVASIYSNVYLNKGLDAKIDKMCQLIRDYDLDGFIMFSVRSCKRYSLGQLVSKEIVSERTGVPGVVIEGDMVDSRLFNESQIETRVEALLEMLL